MPERFLRVAGVRARILDEGAGDAVLLVHGVGGWAEEWAHALPALVAAGYRVVAPDLPGHGQSARASGARYFDPHDPYYVRFLRELLDGLGLERVHVVGHSLGGAIATLTAVCLPGRVRSLTLVAPGGYGARVARSFRLSSLWIAQLFARIAPTAYLRESLAWCFSDASRCEEWMYRDVVRYARAGAAVEFARVLRQGLTLRGLRPEIRDAWDDRVRGLTLPTLVIWGRQDSVVPFADLSDVTARIPHASVVAIDRAGHLVQLERPEEFNRALLAFLKRA